MATIGERIKLIRTSSNLTQTEFGEIIGVVKSTVSLYENGKSTPNDEIKLKICEHFGVSISFLLGLTNSAVIGSGKTVVHFHDGRLRDAFVDLCEIRNLSLKELSESTGIPVERLNSFFKEYVPTTDELVLLADTLSTTIDYLLGRTKRHDLLTSDENDLLYYYSCIPKMDKQWLLGQAIDCYRRAEQGEGDVAASPKNGTDSLK